MSTLTREIEIMHNPALGSFLLRQFAVAHARAHPEHLGAPLPTAFLMLPLVWHSATADYIESTNEASGLRKFAAKFTESDGARDTLLAINSRMGRWRGKTASSLRLAVAAGLVTVSSDARLTALPAKNPRHHVRAIEKMASNCDKLGTWFASLSAREISFILHVNF